MSLYHDIYANEFIFITSLLHRPFFIKFSLLTTKQIIYPQTPFFSGVAVLGLGARTCRAVLVLNGQMSWYVILIFRIILISKRGYIEVDWFKTNNTSIRKRNQWDIYLACWCRPIMNIHVALWGWRGKKRVHLMTNYHRLWEYLRITFWTTLNSWKKS